MYYIRIIYELYSNYIRNIVEVDKKWTRSGYKLNTIMQGQDLQGCQARIVISNLLVNGERKTIYMILPSNLRGEIEALGR